MARKVLTYFMNGPLQKFLRRNELFMNMCDAIFIQVLNMGKSVFIADGNSNLTELLLTTVSVYSRRERLWFQNFKVWQVKLNTLVSLLNEQALINEQNTNQQYPPFSILCSKIGQAGWRMAKIFWCEHAPLIERLLIYLLTFIEVIGHFGKQQWLRQHFKSSGAQTLSSHQPLLVVVPQWLSQCGASGAL